MICNSRAVHISPKALWKRGFRAGVSFQGGSGMGVILSHLIEITTSLEAGTGLFFQAVRNGTEAAIWQGRRSGAQRGALENNFGQRFS